ncbi:MAG TPA: DUF2231 domain-containing protein [Gemmatimonadaceae bacterium]|nr:DUF2231 domain-containing protein [Gemmatimonadaceae bacterium]
MLPNPLHPAIVHFPIVLAFLLPIFALGALWAIRRGARFRRAWLVPVALSAALVLSSWVAVQTGEGQEDRVERVVPDQALDTHEDAAELFLTMSGVLLAVSAVGLVGGVIGRSARVVATVGTAALVVGVARVGHSGGQLVYQYNAASAYAQPGNATVARAAHQGGDHER